MLTENEIIYMLALLYLLEKGAIGKTIALFPNEVLEKLQEFGIEEDNQATIMIGQQGKALTFDVILRKFFNSSFN